MPRIRALAFRHSSARRLLPVVVLIAACALPAFAKKKGSGDFDANGVDDLCIGVPAYTVGTKFAAGAVNCIYGSHTGLITGGEAPLAQIWTQDTDGVQGVSEASDQFGSALAFGDFNGDGYADLCIGVPGETISGVMYAGAVNCLYGSPDGLEANGDVAPLPQLFDGSTTGFKSGLSASAFLGWSLVAGDFNHDGYSDLCIGIPQMTVNGLQSAGEVNCIYGSASGLQTTGIGGAPADQKWNRAISGVAGKTSANSYFGWAVVVADLNGDGYDDLCVGAPGDFFSVGSVTCLYGSSAGLQAVGTKSAPASQFWSQGTSSVKGTGDADNRFGVALAVGDFNHDGFADLAVGAPTSTISPGNVNVIYGSANGLQATGSGGPDDQLLQPGSNSLKGTLSATLNFGSSLTAGDFNHDGYDDLCVGMPFDSGATNKGGSVSCLYGSHTGLQATGTGGPDDQVWSQDSAGVIGTAEYGDEFGWALTAGDFNGDGYLDLAVGVIGEDSDSGGINVLYGSSLGLQTTGVGGPANQFWHQASDGVPGSGGGYFGWALSH